MSKTIHNSYGHTSYRL